MCLYATYVEITEGKLESFALVMHSRGFVYYYIKGTF